MNSQQRFPVILTIATGNPPYKVSQKEVVDYYCQSEKTKNNRSLYEKVFFNSKINSRYFSVPDYSPDVLEAKLDTPLYPEDHSYQVPLEKRFAVYKKMAFPLATEVTARAIEQAGISKADIAKLIVVSSTGFFGPGLDCELVRALDLPRSTERTIVGFTGCAAGINGIRVANDFAKNPDSVGKYALLVCIEVSSTNANFGGSINDAISHCLFSDGCAVAVVGGFTAEDAPKGSLAIIDHPSELLADSTTNFITLDLTANGLLCNLDKDLPKAIGASLPAFVEKVLEKHNLQHSEIDFWSVHPGGARIVEAVQKCLQLPEHAVDDSWAVLAEYGNMTSPTIMFILKRVFERHQAALQRGEQGYQTGMAMAFSPGVGVESIVFKQF